jgi:hypothetical protein
VTQIAGMPGVPAAWQMNFHLGANAMGNVHRGVLPDVIESAPVVLKAHPDGEVIGVRQAVKGR